MTEAPRDEVAAVLAAPLEEFVATRSARAKALKADGRKEEAAALAALRKPTRLAWALGEVRRRHPGEVAEADEAAAKADSAQSGGGGSLRDALRQFRDAVEQVATLVTGIDGGIDPPDAGLAVRALMADPDAHQAWIDGVLLAIPAEGAPPWASRPTRPRGSAPSPAEEKPARRPRLTVVPPPESDDAPEPERRKVTASERRATRQAVRATDAALAKAAAAERAAESDVVAIESELAVLNSRLAHARDALADARDTRIAAAAEADDAHAALDELDSTT